MDPVTDQGKPASPARDRTIVRLVAMMVVFAVGALAVTSLISQDRYEQALIGLTPESEWPFHDVHLATVAGELDDGELTENVQRDLGLPVDSSAVTLDGERQDGNGIVAVTARADSSTDAAALANAVADAMVDAVPADTPVVVVNRADGRSAGASTGAVLVAGAFAGLLVGLVVWPPGGLGGLGGRRSSS